MLTRLRILHRSSSYAIKGFFRIRPFCRELTSLGKRELLVMDCGNTPQALERCWDRLGPNVMIIKLAASAFVILVLVGWAPVSAADRSEGHAAEQPVVAAAEGVAPESGSAYPAEGDPQALIPQPTPAEGSIEWVDDIELNLAESSTFDAPHFVAEPEDPTKVRFIAEPEDPTLVCFMPVVHGHLSVCDLSTETNPAPVPGYEPAP